MTKFDKPAFTAEALAPMPRDGHPVLELSPGLARAPRVAKLLNAAYDIAHRELGKLNQKHYMEAMSEEDWSRFGMLLKNLPALMREERAGDEARMKALGALPEEVLKAMVLEYYELEARDGTAEEDAQDEGPSQDQRHPAGVVRRGGPAQGRARMAQDAGVPADEESHEDVPGGADPRG